MDTQLVDYLEMVDNWEKMPVVHKLENLDLSLLTTHQVDSMVVIILSLDMDVVLVVGLNDMNVSLQK